MAKYRHYTHRPVATGVANMLLSGHLSPAVKAGVVPADWEGRFGFHNSGIPSRSILCGRRLILRLCKALLRDSDVKTTLQLYSHNVTEEGMTGREPS